MSMSEQPSTATSSPSELSAAATAVPAARAAAVAPPPATPIHARHPNETAIGGLGAGAAGVVAGAVVGMVAGPAGAVVGAAIGGVVGAAAGAIAGRVGGEFLNSNSEEEYWENGFVDRPYHVPGTTWDDYCPAYRAGWESCQRCAGRPFESHELEVRQRWEEIKGHSRLTWDQARPAAREAWERMADELE